MSPYNKQGVAIMSVLKEFRDFAVRGNVIDLAIGIIIGGAFGKIISSIVSDIIMPPIGLLIGGVDFTNLFIALNGKTYESFAAAKAAGAPILAYGSFIQAIFDFTIIAIAVFILVKAINKLKSKEEAAPVSTEPPQDVKLLIEIRDLLKK
jgi:large conductance mechanosensitive channel